MYFQTDVSNVDMSVEQAAELIKRKEAATFGQLIAERQAEYSGLALHEAHVETFHDAMAEMYSDMAEVHRDYLGYVYTQAEYLEIESKCHPALFCSAQRPLTEMTF